MSPKKRLFVLNALSKKNRILPLTFTLICVFALVLTAADFSKKSEVSVQERKIQVSGSSVQIILKGNESYRISLDGKHFSREMAQAHLIRMENQVFDPLVNPPQLEMAEIMSSPNAESVNMFIVQCYTQAIEAYQKQISRAGGEICGTLPDHALLVLMPKSLQYTVAQMSFVRWVGPFLPTFKHSPVITDSMNITATGTNHYIILPVKKNKRDAVSDFITSIGGEVLTKSKGRRIDANLSASQLNEVIAHPMVLAVDTWSAPETDMDIAREISGANYLESVQGYTGQGVRAEVCDGGIRATHQDFQYNPPLIHGANSSDNSHGTSVYGIVFGSGAGNPIARGLLPDAEKPIFAAYSSFTDRYAHTQELVNPVGNFRGVFQTNSWGDARVTTYTTISAEMDDIIFDLDVLICQSQSNAGTQDSRPQAWAKNILSVGGWNHYNTLSQSDDCWCTTASIGPASDGRIKPDLSHFYDYTRTTYYSSDTAYADFGGTSGATPITAGYVGLFFQMWADGVFAGGPGLNRDVFNSRPHATTAKAILIHSAYQFPFTGTTHDKTRVHQGWGMIDVNNLYTMAQNHNWQFPILIDESAVIAPLSTHTYTLNATGGEPLRATMVYADPAGVPGAAVHRINDLSLRVTSPSGTIYWGNNGLNSGNWSTSGGVSNKLDTVENVFIQTPEAGTWLIEVLADEVVQDSHVETPALDADYALVVSGGSSTPGVPPVAPSALSLTVASCNKINLTWTDNSNNESTFKIERSINGTTFSEIGTVGANTAAYSDTTVVENTTYWYRVRASNGYGNSDYSNTVSGTTPLCPIVPPAAPTNLKGTAGRNNINLTWTDNSNNETGFKVYRGSSSTNLVLIATVAANTTSYNSTGLARRTTYYFKVCSYNTSGESCSAVISSKTK